MSLQELALRAGELETGRRLTALITETAERYAMPPGTAPAGRLQQAVAERDRDGALSALRALVAGLNQPWDDGGLYPHLNGGDATPVGAVLLPGMVKSIREDEELSFLRDDPELEAILAPSPRRTGRTVPDAGAPPLETGAARCCLPPGGAGRRLYRCGTMWADLPPPTGSGSGSPWAAPPGRPAPPR